MNNQNTLFCFGMGFVGKTLGRLLLAEDWSVIGTARDVSGCEELIDEGFDAFLFTGDEPGEGIDDALLDVTHVVNSVPPSDRGDPVLMHHGDGLANLPDLQWLGILSTVGVYGEHHGDWVDEDTKPAPISPRSKLRLKAELDWQAFGGDIGTNPHIFRLPGIYGPTRNQLETIKRGKARRLVKEGQVFNRIHVEDIAQILFASMQKPDAGQLFNISDDEPAPPQDVVSYACQLLGIEPPPEVKFEEAELTPMARSFYGECKRVKNECIKKKLGITLKYPTYREGLKELLAAD